MTRQPLNETLNQREITRIFANLYGNNTKVLKCEQLQGGVFNTTYRVKTDADPGRLILRVAPSQTDILYDFEQSMMGAEPLFYTLLQEKNIPTSEVVFADTSHTVIDRNYILFRNIDSLPMNNPAVPDKVKPALYEQLGKIVAKIHQIPFNAFGWLRPGGELEMTATWSAFLNRYAQEIAERAARHKVFGDEDLQRFWYFFANTTIFDPITEPRMVHADLWEGNVLVREIESGWAVAAVIDIDKAIFGDPQYEFAFPTLTNADFLKGYGADIDRSEEATLRRNAYEMLLHFMYAYVWQVQLNRPGRYEYHQKAGLTCLDRLELI